MNKIIAPWLFFVALMWGGDAHAQSAAKFTINGYVEDSESGERLFGVNVFDANTLQGTITNDFGFFSLTLPSDTIALTVSYIGYPAQAQEFFLDKDITINFKMDPSINLKEVEVVASQAEKIQEKTQMSTIDISMDKVKSLPVLLGERDVMKTIQLLPGVQSGGEGTSGLYVRGGGPDQNLILLDGVPVYNASHLFGFFSVFNADAIKSVSLIKGGFPARYGGRLSSVLDIKMKDGNKKKLHGEGSIGLVSSKLTLEGPIIKDRTSFIVSGRRTYIDLLAQPFIRAEARRNGSEAAGGYYFYDVNAKVNHKFSETSRLFLSTYFGNDKFYARYEDDYVNNGITETEKNSNSLGWGNIITALRWNKIINKKLFSNSTLTYSRYRFLVDIEYEESTEGPGISESTNYGFEYLSGIYDWSGKIDFDYLPTPDHYVKFGVGNTYHTFTPGVNTVQFGSESSTIDTSFGSQKQYAHEFWMYVEDDFEVNALLKINGGLHFSGFYVGDKLYTSLQPRFAGRYLMNEEWSLKASYARMTQYIHLLTNATVGLPTDLWVPVTDTVPPQFSNQIAIGMARTIKEKYEVSVEAYYKTMENLIEYKDGASFLSASRDWQEKVEFGRGWSYGFEVFIEKKHGKTSGWIGYTLSWTNRQFDNVNFGDPFPYKFDRRHDISFVLTHKFNDRCDVGMTWVYGTGNAVTLPTGQYYGATELPWDTWTGNTVEHVESRNGFRQPSYHRLDVGVNLHKKTKWGERTWSWGVYNMYSRQNPFYLYFGFNDNNERALKQISLFPIIPSFSYSFKF